MLEQRLIRTSALHRRTGEVILWIQLPLNNTYNRYTIPIILLQIDNYHSIILLQIQLPFNNVYFQSTMLLRLQLPLRMQLPPNTDQLLLLLLENLQKSSPAMSGHPLLGNIVISVKTRRWMSPHHPEIHVNVNVSGLKSFVRMGSHWTHRVQMDSHSDAFVQFDREYAIHLWSM